MTFHASKYVNFVSASSQAQERLFLQYIGPRHDFDIIIVGSGIGGGVLADDLGERFRTQKRVLVLEAGSFIYPTHVYNICRFTNASVAKHFGCDTFWQPGDSSSQNFIGEKPQLNFGGRSVCWSGLIPSIQGWELDFFPPRVKQDLASGLLNSAGETMNESRSMGATAQAIVAKLRQSPLAQDFSIQETPRALHQPYLAADGTPKDQYFTEPTGVFNTAELLIVEMNINHEYWHLRENDPTESGQSTPPFGGANGPSRIDIKFSFGNCLDDVNEVKPAPPFEYVPEIAFRNLSWMDHLAGSRFPALAGWQKSHEEIFAVMNHVTHQIFSRFQINGASARPFNEEWYGQAGKGFGWGTVHHAAGSLRMPYRPSHNASFNFQSVVDEDLRVVSTQHLYVCDMSVMPFSSAANPVRTLVALALRLSRHFG
jgi:GMC oxidoreductase